MQLRKSCFAHQITVGANSFLLLHAVSQLRLKVDGEIDRLVRFFTDWHEWPRCYEEVAKLVPYDEKTLAACIHTLIERGFLTDKNEEEEFAIVGEKMGATYGRDPGELLDRYRRESTEGAKSYWAAGIAQSLRDLAGDKTRINIALFGDCDLHMESDFLRSEALQRGYDLRVAATAPDDFAFVTEHVHAAVLIGALYARHSLMDASPDAYIAQARHMLQQLRARTNAPILIDNLPEPTVQPLGIAERGEDGHRTRFRRANIALAELAESFADVFVTDVAATLGAAGSLSLIDDGQVSFTHMGSPGWMLQRPESEKAAVHDQMPDMASLAASVSGDPYRREKVMAAAHIDQLIAVLGLGRKKCVIVDLDNTLWPGVLAETGAPFAWDPSISGTFSYIGLYFGIHEALLSLKKRGIVLACVSKNDESVVRALWKYPDIYPRSRLLTLDDFVTHRINWNDKAENIRSIVDELGFATDAFLFIDDNPVERDRVQKFLPEIMVWGEDLFGLRRALLTDPRLQIPKVTEESAARTVLVKAQLGRQKFRTTIEDEKAYIASLEIRTEIKRITSMDRLDRIEELFSRTTQFNTTGRLFTAVDLQILANNSDSCVFALYVADRFGDHGLVGAAVIEKNDITGLVISCRVLGMGVEHTFLKCVIDVLMSHSTNLMARIIETERNIPVRNIYRDNGFSLSSDGSWHYTSGNNLSSKPV